MKKLLLLLLLPPLCLSILYAVTADELVRVHRVTTTEMNNISTPLSGSLVYNITVDTLFFYTGTVWKKMRSDGNETAISAGSGVVVSGNGINPTPYKIGVD